MAAKKAKPSNAAPVVKLIEPKPEEAFQKLEARLDALNPERFTKSRIDYSAAATLVVDKVTRVITAPLEARLRALPRKEFDPANIELSVQVARALQYVAVRRANAEAAASSALVPIEAVQAASTLKGQMLRVLDYHLDDDQARRELADIVSGQGYLDLAQDLRRLADLYRRFGAQLAVDKRRYRATDRERASELADAVSPSKSSPDTERWVRLCRAAWTILEASYRDVRDTVFWLERNSGITPDLPLLHAALSTRSSEPTEPDPAPVEEPPADQG